MLTVSLDLQIIHLGKQIYCSSYPTVIRLGKIVVPKYYPTGSQDPLRPVYISPSGYEIMTRIYLY